ncbi:MAG: cytochrome P450 [Cyanobacteria bacterium P01_A01_bin.114]
MADLRQRRPPGPQYYWFFKASKLQHHPIEALGSLWHEYGDLVRLPIMPGLTFYLASHPDYAEHILATHSDLYGKPDTLLKSMGLVQGQGLFTSEGEFWRHNRRLIQPAFHHSQLHHFHDVILQCTNALLQEWEQKPAGEIIDIAAEMTRLTLKIIGLALFSVDISDDANVLGKALRTAIEYVYYRMAAPLALPVGVPTHRNRRFRQAKQTIDRVVQSLIQARRQNPTQQHDLLAMLLAAQDEETGQGMSDRQLQDEMITLINAGHETSATTLAWTWYLLGTHPDAMAAIADEVQTVLNGHPLTYEALPRLQYTRRVLDESLRLRPPGLGLMRQAYEADEIHGYFIPKGANCIVGQYFILRHPDFWENPDRFDPDRFLPEKVACRPKFAYLPFGAGPHVCIGKNLALMELVMILAGITQRFHVDLVPDQVIEVDPRFTLRPRGGVKVNVRAR